MSEQEQERKVFESIPFWLIEKNEPRKDSYFFKLKIKDVVVINFDIPGVIESGQKAAIVDVDGGQGMIPNSEFSVSASLNTRIIGKTRNGYLKEIVNIEYEDGSTEKLAVFSTKDYEKEFRKGRLDELQAKGSVVAEVIGFTDYSVILLWNNIRLELFNNGLFGRHKNLSAEMFLSLGSKVPVKLKKIAKNGKLIQVEAINKLDDPVYTNEIDQTLIEDGQEMTGIVVERDQNNISVQVGRNSGASGGKKGKIIVRCFHPHPAIDSQVFEDQVVRVKITEAKVKKSGNVALRGIISSVYPHYIDDAVVQFRSELDSTLLQLEEEEE